jgi:hypothetical protein
MTKDAGTQSESSQDDVSSSELVQRVYTHLHQLAKRHMAEQPPGHTLQATALDPIEARNLVSRPNYGVSSHYCLL